MTEAMGESLATDSRPIPYERIAPEVWRRLADAAERRDHPMRLFVLASVDEARRPDARLLILRGANPERGVLWFHTDRRSRKIAQYRSCPHASAVVYDPRDCIELRLWGRVAIHAGDEIARLHWEQTDIAARHAFAATCPPAAPLRHPDPQMTRRARRLEPRALAAARENFAVLEFSLDRIEWLQVNDAGDRRAALARSDQWVVAPLAP